MKRRVLVCLILVMLLCNVVALAYTSIGLPSSSGAFGNHITEVANTKYNHIYVTLRVGETYTGSLRATGGIIKKEGYYTIGSKVVVFEENTENGFTIRAVNVGTASVHPSYRRNIGIYGDTSHSGASEEDVLHVAVIPSDMIVKEKKIEAPNTSSIGISSGSSSRQKEITLSVGETYTTGLEIESLNCKITDFYLTGNSDAVFFLNKSNTGFTVLAIKEGTVIVKPSYDNKISGGKRHNPEWMETLKITVKGSIQETPVQTEPIPEPEYQQPAAIAGEKINWNGHTYMFVENRVASWQEARAYCEEMGGHLATISSAEENDFIARNLVLGHYYIGGTDGRQDGVWEWITGESFTYFNWSPGEPNNLGGGQPYILMYGPTSDFTPGTWDDCWGENGHAAGYICEWDEENDVKGVSDDTIKVCIVSQTGKQYVDFDEKPFAENGRTLVPLRAIFEALGAQVVWNGETGTVEAQSSDNTVSLKIGSDQMYVNGNLKVIEVPAKARNGRTFVPVRAVSEALGNEVGWDNGTKTVMISAK